MFNSNRELLKKARGTLATVPSPTPELGELVCRGLAHMAQSSLLFDASVCHGVLFTNHFLDLLTSLPFQDESDWFALFEDMALFVREKKLRNPQERLPVVEQHILEYFETSEEWNPEDGHLVTLWYWYRLPLAVLNENRH